MYARDIMQSRVVTISDDATVQAAVRLMLQHRVSGLPVVDNKQELVGIVTEGDFLRRAEIGTQKQHSRWIGVLLGSGRLADEYRLAHTRHIRDVMTAPAHSVEETTTVREIVEAMERHNVKRLPVVHNKKVVGIVSRVDLLHALVVSAAVPHSTQASDAAIRSAIVAEMNRQPWAAGNSANVLVHDGIVELHGAVLDERERLALRVIAENTPGVKKVNDRLFWIDVLSGMAFGPATAA